MTTNPLPAEKSDAAGVHDPVHDTIEALHEMLAARAKRHPETTPQWEFCEGLMAALLCTRREVGQDEWLTALFQCRAGKAFENEAERTRFLMLWLERQAQLRAQLEASLETMEDELPFKPAIMDWRGALASLPEAERAQIQQKDGPPPAFAWVWAQGFMLAVHVWDEDWRPPRDKTLARDMVEDLNFIMELMKDDTGTPTLNLIDENGPPSISQARMEAFDDALWGVQGLFDLARHLGPRVEPARSQREAGRNDPCPCGSGKKYKKCCGR